MLYSIKHLALLALVAPTDAISWIKGSTGTCAGISNPCSSSAQCTATYIGPCEDATTGAEKYFTQHTEGTALVKISDYNTNPAHIFQVTASGPGFRDFSGSKLTSDNKPYAYMMTGDLFGDYTTFGSYLGVGAYFNTGTQSITSSSAEFYSAHITSDNRVTRDDSSIGAPNGPYTMCIEESSSPTDSSCGTKPRTWPAGDFKFSIFGYTWEASPGGYATGYAAAATPSGFGFAPDYFGVRQKLTAHQFSPTDVSFNNGAFTLSGLNFQDITQMTVTLASGKTIDWTFPATYRWGTLAGITATSGDLTGPTYLKGGGTVKIKVFQVPNEAALFVDYLFPMDEFKESGKWFVYDPDIDTSGGTVDNNPSDPDANDPCFPSSAMVTKADGTLVRVDTLKEGDEIVSTTVDGTLTTDTVSLLSIAKPEASDRSFLSLTTTANATILLTPEHHLPVGETCCSSLKKAKDVAVREKVWTVIEGKAVATGVVAKTATTAAGLHSPVMSSGTFPVVDGVITSFDSISKVTLAKHGLGPLLTACKATGTCDTFRDLFLGDDK